MGKSSRHINGVILGDPSGTSSDPIGEKEGQAYWNDTLQKFRYFNGVVWGDLGSYDIVQQTRLISGGMVWISGLTFGSVNLSYEINGELFVIADGTEVTAAAADPTNPRTDLIYGDDTGALGISEGTPSVNPQANTLEFYQIQLTIIDIAAAGTTPEGVSRVDVYLENDGQPAEYDATESTGGVRIDLADITTPLSGTYSIKTLSALLDGDVINFTYSTTFLISDFANIQFSIKLLAAWGNDYINIGFYNGSTLVAYVALDATFLNLTNITTSQYVTIFKSSLNLNGTEYDKISFGARVRGGSTLEFILDNITIAQNPNSSVPRAIKAIDVSLETTSFDNNLNSSIVDVQKLADALDDLVLSSGGVTDYIDFNNNLPDPAYLKGRLFYDRSAHTLGLYNDESETILQIGEEQRIRVYNSTASTILNGQAVTVTGVTVDGIVEVGLAIASDEDSALNTIGIATHDIEVGTYGYATTSGIVRGLDMSAYTEGVALWLSSTVAGAYQQFRPESPNYEVRMGGIVSNSATEGKIYAELRIINNSHDNSRFLNGSILEDHQVTVSTTPTVTTFNVLEYGTTRGFLSLLLNQNYTKVTVPASIALTNGTDTVPVMNYVYFDNLGVLSISTTAFPTATQHVPVAQVLLQSAASANTYKPYKVHAWTDHLADRVGQGHLSHINKWIRNRPALWKSGVVLSTTIGSALPTIPLAYSSGVVSQLHLHNFPAVNTATGNGFYGANNPLIPYVRRTSISPSIDTDSTGTAIGNNKYYTLVIWGSISEDLDQCKIFYNAPSGSYTNITDALNDVNKYTNFSIPDNFLGTGFLISQMTIQRTTTTVQIITNSVKDLRGQFPATSAGGGTIGGAGITLFTQLSDTPISITAKGVMSGNNAGTALEFLPIPTASQILRRNAGDTAYEWFTLRGLEAQVTQTTHNFSVGNAIYHNGSIYVKAQADDISTSAVVGIVSVVTDANNFTFQYGGILTVGTWTLGVDYFLSVSTLGLISTEPTYNVDAGEIRQYIGTGVVGGLLINIDIGEEITSLPTEREDRVLENATVTTTQVLDYSLYEMFNFTMTGDTTFSESNLPTSGSNGKVILINMTGDFSPTYPTNWSTNISGVYDGTVNNTIVVWYVKSGVYKVQITQPD